MLSKKEWEAIDAEAGAYRKISADRHSEAQAEIARLQAEVERLTARSDAYKACWKQAEDDLSDAWNDAIEAAAKLAECGFHPRDIRALRRPTNKED